MNRINSRAGLLKTMLALSIPTVLEQVLTTLLQYVDTAMVGRLGEQATAPVSITTTVTWLVTSISTTIGTAILALTSQTVGSEDCALCEKLSQQALLLAAVCGFVCDGVSIALSPFIPVWMGAEPAIQRQASVYFFIISLPMVFRSANTILGAAIRATQNTVAPMVINMAANFLNAGLNYLLIYRCALGVTGAAIATAVSHTVSGTLMFLLYRRTPLLRWKWQDLSPDIPQLRRCAKIGLPVLGTSMTSCLGYVVFAGLVSNMGTTVFAAHSIAITAKTIFYIPGYGLRTATSALVGVSLGEGNKEKLVNISKLSVALTIGMMCLSGLLLYWIAGLLTVLFSPVEALVELGAEMLRLMAFCEPFFGLMVVLEGIFYGLGRSRYPFCIETASMWGVRIMLTFLCVKVWLLDLRAVWFCMSADNVCKAVLFAAPFFRKQSRDRLLSL